MSLYIIQRPPTPLSQLAAEGTYDLALVSVGFEERSRAVALALAEPAQGVGLTFPDRREGDFGDNVEAVTGRGYGLWQLDEEDSRALVSQLSGRFERAAAQRTLSDERPLRIAVDISSMTRPRIAAVIGAAFAIPEKQPAIVDLFYAPAEYRPYEQRPGAWVEPKPVSERLAGWDPDAEKELLAVVGLGYETLSAEGVIEWLTPYESLMFVPNGRDQRYRHDVEAANEDVLRQAAGRRDYLVEDPYRLVLDLERLLLSRLPDRRVLLVPLGPKIFAAACMVVAERLYPLVSAWRFTKGAAEGPTPAAAAGRVCGMRLATRPESTPGFSLVREAENGGGNGRSAS